MEERNKLWRRKQQYRLLKSRIVKRADGFRGFMLDDGTYVQHPHWTQLIKSHWAQKCTRPLAHRAAAHCARARAIHASPTSTKPNELSKNRKCKKKHFGEKSQRLSRVRVAPQYGFLCVMDL